MSVKEYNQIDMENDSLLVIEAKVAAIAKDLQKRAESNEEEKPAIDKMLGKPLGEWP